MLYEKTWGKRRDWKFSPETGAVERIWHYYKRGDDNSAKEIEFIKYKSYKTFLSYYYM